MLLEDGEISVYWVDAPPRVPTVQLDRDDLLVRQFVAVPWYPQDVRLRFQRHDSGQITGLTLTCDMVRGVEFTRLDR